MRLPFFKMHAQGNDYIYFDFHDREIPDISFRELSQRLSTRRFGIGADGVVLILPPSNDEHDARMRIFNADGGEAELCGSALRCITAYLAGKKGRDSILIETLAGFKKGTVLQREPYWITQVKMGKPSLVAERKVQGLVGLEIDMGNPHFVIYDDKGPITDIMRIGPMLEKDGQFPGGVNVHYVVPENPTTIHMGIWERGSGPTLACGTGACAAAYAGIRLGILTGAVIDVHQPGGITRVHFDAETQDVRLSGEVTFVFDGFVES